MTQHWDSMHPERFTLAGKVNVGCPWCPLRFDVEKPLAYLEHAGSRGEIPCWTEGPLVDEQQPIDALLAGLREERNE